MIIIIINIIIILLLLLSLLSVLLNLTIIDTLNFDIQAPVARKLVSANQGLNF